MDTNYSSVPKPFEAPGGLDLHPQPEEGVHISRRTGMAIISVIVLMLLAFAYGGYRRTLTNQAAARDANLPKNVTPATLAGTEFLRATPTGTVPLTHAIVLASSLTAHRERSFSSRSPEPRPARAAGR